MHFPCVIAGSTRNLSPFYIHSVNRSPIPSRKRIALLGGAFDPIHLDHLRLAEKTLRLGMADEVWLVPAPDLRWDKRTAAPAFDRLAMIRSAIDGTEKVRCCDAEIAAGEYRGTLRLLEWLEQNHPDADFLWMIGSDSYPRIPSWRDPTEGWEPNGEELMRRFALIVWPRPGCEMPDRLLHEALGRKPLVFPPEAVWGEAGSFSSTEVREKIGRGEGAEGLLHPAVADYIARNRLYGSPG